LGPAFAIESVIGSLEILAVCSSGIFPLAMANPTATFDTSLGQFKVEIFANEMPITAGNFMSLIRGKFYDGVHFHRVIKSFMLQGGCPNSKDPSSATAGRGGPDPNTDYTTADGRAMKRDGRGKIPDEHTAKISNEPMTLSMANSGPNSGGSQFFINTKHNAYLDWWRDDLGKSQHPVFGKVIAGQDVIAKIESTPTSTGDKPKTPVKINWAKMDG